MNIVTDLGLGTAALGRPQYINLREKPYRDFSLNSFKDEGTKLLDKAYVQGIRYFDTAPGYGIAEQLLIDWLRSNEPKDVEVATKWGYTYTANFDLNAIIHEVKDHSFGKLKEQWQVSQALLPYLKYYQIHSATFETNVLKNDKVLNHLGEIRDELGVIIGLTTSGDNQVEFLKRAIEIKINGKRLFELFQVTYNVFEQSLNSVCDLIKEEKLRIVVKEALANGRVFPNVNFSHYKKTYEVLKSLSRKYGVGIDSVALRFCLDSIPCFKVLSGASNPKHLSSNLEFDSFKLEKEEVDRLRNLAFSVNEYWKERKKLSWN